MATVILVVISDPVDSYSVMLLTHVVMVNYLWDGIRNKTSQNNKKIRDLTSPKNPISLVKKIESKIGILFHQVIICWKKDI